MLARPFVLGLLFTALASAQTHVWVDPVHGSDTNGGTDEGDAWRTLTHAVAEVQAATTGERFVHLLPGTYDAAGGEVFPIDLERGTRLVGEAGADSTVIVGDQSEILRFTAQSGVPWARVEGLQIVGLGVGTLPYQVGLMWLWPTAEDEQRLELVGCIVRDMSTGVVATRLVVTACAFQDLEDGVVIDDLNTYADAVVSDSTFERCGNGIAEGSCYGLGTEARVVRCAFTSCDHGIRMVINCHNMYQSLDLVVEDSVFWRSTFADLAHEQGKVELVGSTFDGAGIASVLNSFNSGDLRNCISVGHTVADATGNASTQENCFFGDGSYAGSSGNITGPDPGFVDADGGDHRLRFGSVCVDRGGTSASKTDHAGRSRVTDGDLDGAPALDLGAWELATLAVPPEVAIGSAYELELNGPAGRQYQLFFSRDGLASAGQQTPFGRYFLPASATRIRVGAYPAGEPELVQYSIPDHSALIGSTFAFQALARDPSLAAGAAWTQPATLMVVDS